LDYYWYVLIGASLLGIIPAYIAHEKGHDYPTWWAIGTLCLIIFIGVPIIVQAEQRARAVREERKLQAEKQAEQLRQEEKRQRELTVTNNNNTQVAQRIFTRGGGYLAAQSEDALAAAMDSREAAARLIASGHVTRDVPTNVEVEFLSGGDDFWGKRARVRIKKTGDVIWIESRGLDFR